MRRPVAAVLSSPGPRRRDAAGDPGTSPSEGPGTATPGSPAWASSRHSRTRLPDHGPWSALPIHDHRSSGSHRSNGREAGLASRPRRAPGVPLAGQLRDLAARHRARGRRRPAVPDRRPERLRQGLARDPLPLADHPDPRPDRRLQRPGRVRRRVPRRAPAETTGPTAPRPSGRQAPTAAAATAASTSASSRPGSAARAARPTSTPATPSPTSSSARPTGWPTRPACRSRSARAMPTTRSSCTAGSASARPT